MINIPLEVKRTIDLLSIDKIEYNDIEKSCKKLNKYMILTQNLLLGNYWYEVEFKFQKIIKNKCECNSENSTRTFISYCENKQNATKINI